MASQFRAAHYAARSFDEVLKEGNPAPPGLASFSVKLSLLSSPLKESSGAVA